MGRMGCGYYDPSHHFVFSSVNTKAFFSVLEEGQTCSPYSALDFLFSTASFELSNQQKGGKENSGLGSPTSSDWGCVFSLVPSPFFHSIIRWISLFVICYIPHATVDQNHTTLQTGSSTLTPDIPPRGSTSQLSHPK